MKKDNLAKKITYKEMTLVQSKHVTTNKRI